MTLHDGFHLKPVEPALLLRLAMGNPACVVALLFVGEYQYHSVQNILLEWNWILDDSSVRLALGGSVCPFVFVQLATQAHRA